MSQHNQIDQPRTASISEAFSSALPCLALSKFIRRKGHILSAAVFALMFIACGGDEEIVEETIIPPMQVAPGGPGDGTNDQPSSEDTSLPETVPTEPDAQDEDVSEGTVADTEEETPDDTMAPSQEDAVGEPDAGSGDTEAMPEDGMEDLEGDSTEDDDSSSVVPEDVETQEGEGGTEDSSTEPEVNNDLKNCMDGCGADDLECTGVCGGSPLCLAQCAAANTECLDACEANFGD